MIHQLRALAVLLSTALALGACAGGGPSASPTADTAPTAQADATPGAGGVVTIGFAAPEFERQVYEPLIAAFNEENPDIRVQFVSLEEATGSSGPSINLDNLVPQLASAADTAAVFALQPEDVKNGYLYDVTPLMEADSAFDRDDFYSGMLEAGTIDGNLYLLPRSVQVGLLSYNKDLWLARGLPSPSSNWSWSDMAATAEQLAQKNGDTIDTYGFADWNSGMTALAGELAGTELDLRPEAVEQLRIDQPEVEAALERVADLVESGAIYEPGAGGPMNSGEIQELIKQQQVGMWRSDMLFQGPNQAKPPFAIGTVAFPDIPSPFLSRSAEGYIMSAGTQHPEEAWRWLSFLSRQEIRRQGVFIGGGTEVPARKSIAERSGFWSQLDEETTAAIEAAIERFAQRGGASAPDVRVFDVLSQALNGVLEGKQASEALREAQAALDQRVAEAQLTPTADSAAGPIVVSTPVPDIAPEGATQITFSSPGFNAPQIRQIAREFNQQHPEIFVDVANIPPGGGALSLEQLAATSDCFSWYQPPAAAEFTATLDLQPLIDADAAFAIDDYPAALLAPFQYQNGLYGLPNAVSLRVLKYNKEAFDAAGLDYPNADWTLDDFIAAAQQLTSGSDEETKQYGFASLGSQTADLRFFLDRYGAVITQGSGDSLQLNFTDEKVIQAIQAYLDLLQASSPHKSVDGYTTSPRAIDSFGLVNSGRVGMWFDFGTRMIVVGGEQQASFTTAIAPPPMGGGPATANDVQISGLYISAQTKQPDACWSWMKYLSENLSTLTGDSDFPARRSLAESEAFRQQATPGAAEVYAAYLEALQRAPENVGAGGSDRPPVDLFWFYQAIDNAMQGEDLANELSEAQSTTEAYLACVRGGVDAGECAKQIDPNYNGFGEGIIIR